MKNLRKTLLVFVVLIFGSVSATSQNKKSSVTESEVKVKKSKRRKNRVKLPQIDLNHWKVTIPEGKGKGGAISVSPPEILNYANNEVLEPFMYNDTTTGALVFHAYPTDATTANTKYSRSELGNKWNLEMIK